MSVGHSNVLFVERCVHVYTHVLSWDGGMPSSMKGVICLGTETFTSSELRCRDKEGMSLHIMVSMVLK